MTDWMQKRRDAKRPVDEAGGGESEGFEMAEEQLVEQAENFDEGRSPERDAFAPEDSAGTADVTYGEADEEHNEE